ncbi:hypothetical protein NQ317_015708 [Molorchus minor]|uniref:Uncharacterized protein n=1 Tax=Molorchus minor TaxID=1323400 RepID=A0ABQ9JMR4_9CUCU|nr:hypothetical protein NQ317_015708 [Molorchus minor]
MMCERKNKQNCWHPNPIPRYISIKSIKSSKMADLKKDLDEYFLLQSDQKKFKLQMPVIQKPNIKGWFGKEQPEEDNTWFQETQKGNIVLVSQDFKE